ncbi:glycosyltransferase [Aureococcus anophagefferens]|nr:glycosyltransferase [Aureococcus anophagefferens]
MARRSSPDPVITVQRAKRSGAKSGGGASYSAVAIVAAIIMLQGAATLVLHGKWHAAGHGAHHSLEEEHDAPPVAPVKKHFSPPQPPAPARRRARRRGGSRRPCSARARPPAAGRESIFISIASYRDPECAKTVARAYARAASPERVFFGIYQQNNASVDVDCVAGLADLVACPDHPVCGRLDQLRVHRVDWKQTLGPTIARHLSEKFYRGETYVMSFDSHTNLARGWDDVAIDMFKRIGNPRAIITTYPASYSATKSSEKWQDVDASGPCLPCRRTDDQASIDVKVLSSSQMSICRTRRVQVGRTTSFKHDVNHMKRPGQPNLVPFLAAGFNFANGSRVLEVPYDAHSLFLFDGEETSLAVRAWTHGYDFYHPDRDVVSHLYIPSKSPLRPVFWTDDWDLRSRIQFWTMLRVNYLLGLHDLLDYWVDAALIDLRDAKRYGCGSKRRAVDYWGYVGVTPDRDGAEWSPGRCDVFSTTGLPSFPVDERGAHNDYDAYADAFPKAEMLEAAVDAKYDAQAARMPRGRSTLPLQDRTAAPPEVMAEESKYAGGATSLTDLRELVERQDLKIEALTALVRAQQITMDRLLRAVEKGAPVPAGAAHPIPSPFPSMPLAPIDLAAPAGLAAYGASAYGPPTYASAPTMPAPSPYGSAYGSAPPPGNGYAPATGPDPAAARRIEAEALANARFEEQRQAAARREAERAAAEAEAERQRARAAPSRGASSSSSSRSASRSSARRRSALPNRAVAAREQPMQAHEMEDDETQEHAMQDDEPQGLTLPDAVLSEVFAAGGFVVRARGALISRDWRHVAVDEAAWRGEYARRWWQHGTAGDEHDPIETPSWWRAAFGTRIASERAATELFAALLGPGGELPLSRSCVARDLEALVEAAPALLLELLATVGALAGDRHCVNQFAGVVDADNPHLGGPWNFPCRFIRKPPTRDVFRYAAFCGPCRPRRRRASRCRARDEAAAERAACHAGAALARASGLCCAGARVDTFEAGLRNVAGALRVFFDDAGVSRELARLADLARSSAEAEAAPGGDDVARELRLMTAVERLLFDGADPARPPLRGNRGDYYDAENSLVDAILERRLGIPISIASVFVAVCVRAGVRDDAIAPVNAPGHFPCGIQIFNPTSMCAYATATSCSATSPRIYFWTSSRAAATPRPARSTAAASRASSRGTTACPSRARASLDAALRSRPTPADVCRRALRNLAAIYDDDPCGSLVTCSLAAALEDAPGAAAISPLTAAIRCKLALADGGYDRGATHDRDRVLVLAGSLRRDLDAVGALMAGDVPADQRHALGRVLAVARAHLAKFSPPFEDAEPP